MSTKSRRPRPEERLRCRYTVARYGCQLLMAKITGSRDEHLPRDLTSEEIEHLREMNRLYHLPSASEKTYAEARAHLARDAAEAALRDAEIVGSGDWRLFLEAEYLPLLRYEQEPCAETRSALMQAIVRKAGADHAGRGGIGWHLEYDEEGNPPDHWSGTKTGDEMRKIEVMFTELLEFAEAVTLDPSVTPKEFAARLRDRASR